MTAKRPKKSAAQKINNTFRNARTRILGKKKGGSHCHAQRMKINLKKLETFY